MSRERPPLSRLPAYPITAGIGLLAVAVTLLTASGRWELARFEVSPLAFRGEPWRLVISALPHVLDVGRFDVFHLPFNLYWLWVFGTRVEDVFGHVKALGLILLLAAGSAAAEYALFRGGIGLSGVGYGLFALTWYLSRRDGRFSGAIDARTTQLMVGWFFLCIVATASRVWEVANVAHGVGALLGLLVGLAIAARRLSVRLLAGLGVPIVLAASWLGASTFRSRVNLAHDAHGSFALGLTALQAGRWEEGVRHYEDAVKMDPASAPAWYNLGIGYESSGRGREAVGAYKRAHDIDPHDTRHRSVYVAACRKFGIAAVERSDHAEAARLLAVAAEMEGDDAVTWLILAHSYDALGQVAEAHRARERAAKAATTDAP